LPRLHWETYGGERLKDPVVNRTLQQATEFAPTCLGLFGPTLSKTVNEDCLYLDVFAPADATTDSKLPVWFFIQGGGYAGDTDENFNFTEAILKSNYSMVAVQINYRVGAFGFLASEEIRQNGDLNVGLLDQRKYVLLTLPNSNIRC
jgi:carboxylesterase type B